MNLHHISPDVTLNSVGAYDDIRVEPFTFVHFISRSSHWVYIWGSVGSKVHDIDVMTCLDIYTGFAGRCEEYLL
jgi:hypothetical protein